MHIVIDLFPWEQIFIGSGLGLLFTTISMAVTLVRRRVIGPLRWFCLALFAVGAILPWLSQPRFGARLRRSGETNIAATSEDAEWPELKPRRYTRSSAEVADAVIRTLAHLNWRLASQEATTLNAEVPIMGGVFTDDFRIMFTPADQQTVVNVRSNSRIGRGDFGANRRHIVQFFIVLEQQLEAPALQH